MIFAVAPRNLKIVPTQPIYYPADKIYCLADGKPTPSYQWTNLDSGTVIQKPVLVISKDMVDKNYTFVCTARNKYNGNLLRLIFCLK